MFQYLPLTDFHTLPGNDHHIQYCSVVERGYHHRVGSGLVYEERVGGVGREGRGEVRVATHFSTLHPQGDLRLTRILSYRTAHGPYKMIDTLPL